jgi:hypothetical protein
VLLQLAHALLARAQGRPRVNRGAPAADRLLGAGEVLLAELVGFEVRFGLARARLLGLREPLLQRA